MKIKVPWHYIVDFQIYGQTFDNTPLPENDSTKFVKVLNIYGKKFYSGFEFKKQNHESSQHFSSNWTKIWFFYKEHCWNFVFLSSTKPLLVFFFPYILLNQLEGEEGIEKANKNNIIRVQIYDFKMYDHTFSNVLLPEYGSTNFVKVLHIHAKLFYSGF